MRLTWVLRSVDPDAPSGGDRYDAAAIAQWRTRGAEVEVVTPPGAWPEPTRAQAEAVVQRLDLLDTPQRPGRDHQAPVIIDGLIGAACPEAVQRSARRRPTLLLVHLPLPVEAPEDRAAAAAESEGAAVRAAHVVVATSTWAARDLQERYPGCTPAVAAPGVDPAPVAAGSLAPDRERAVPSARLGPDHDGAVPQLLTLGSVTPRKNALLLVEALGSLTDRGWRAVLAGPTPDPQHLAQVQAAARRHGITERLRLTGPVTGPALDRLWSGTDLLVHPSRVETYGMVVTEAQARGIPAVVVRGTGAQEALGAGGGYAVGPGAGDLAQALRDWLTDAGVRRRWRADALSRRAELPGWEATVSALTGAVALAEQRAGVSPS